MLIVKKFGGTSVGNKERILNVAKRCIEDYQKGNDVVVVMSISISLFDGVGLISFAISINSSVDLPIADETTTTSLPFW